MRSFAFRTYDLANTRQTATATHHHQASKVDKHILASMKGPGTFPGRQLAVWLLLASQCSAFAPVGPSSSFAGGAPAARPLGRSAAPARGGVSSTTELRMGLDLATYLRTEWISAALCTNQTPVEADVCLQLGTDDGRAVTFIPKTIRTLVTSSAEADGKLTVSARRQLKQQADRRKAAQIKYIDQRCDDLGEVDDESVDVVISLQAAQRMTDNGQDWKKSVQESARVLKPGGRLLFVEATKIGGVSYLNYIENLYVMAKKMEGAEEGEDAVEDEPVRYPVFDEVGFDDVDLVLVPHIAGVAIKAEDAALTVAEREAMEKEKEEDMKAERAFAAFERGRKRRRKKKKKTTKDAAGDSA